MPLSSPLRLPLRLGLTALAARRGGGAAFDPASLFLSGELGFWYDPSDLTTMFQDTAGTVPVTAAGQLVARINDKSGRGANGTQATEARRPILRQDAAGNHYLEFDASGRWLNTPTINAGTDKATVFFAAMRTSNASRGMIVETSPDYGRNGGMAVMMPHGAAVDTAAAYIRGTTETAFLWPYFNDDLSTFAVSFDIAGADRTTEIRPLQNGATPVLSGTGAANNAGTGNIGNFPYTIGARQGGTAPFVGRLYGLCVRFASTSDSDIERVNRFYAEKAGILYMNGNPDSGIQFTSEQIDGLSLSLASNRQHTSSIKFTTTAVGAIPSGGGSRPTIALTNNSITHPKILYVPDGFAGYRYWMAATPYWGLVGSDSQYENPHIWCSNDGYKWLEPTGITNPIDLPENEFPNHSYWSDTHLALGTDGYLYCYYRGVGPAFGGATNFYRRSLDGVTWSDPRVLLVTSDNAVSPVILRKPDDSFEYYETKLTPARGILKVSMTGPATVANKATGTDMVFTNTPWAGTQGVWHVDIEYVGGVYIALINTGAINSSGGDELWIAYSVDGLNYTVVTSKVGPSNTNYRSTFVPVRLADNRFEVLVWAAQTNGVVSVWHVVLDVA